eukprot:scaffold311823_cov75-Attheya_sp.AAC.2
MSTSHHHAIANCANSDQPPNDVILQTDSTGVHMDTGVDPTSVRDHQRWWQSDQEGISLLATAAGAAVDLPYYFHDDDDASSITRICRRRFKVVIWVWLGLGVLYSVSPWLVVEID